MNDENVRIWKEAEVAYLKVLIACSSLETEEIRPQLE
jgi:hypothetical protein